MVEKVNPFGIHNDYDKDPVAPIITGIDFASPRSSYVADPTTRMPKAKRKNSIRKTRAIIKAGRKANRR